MQERQAKLIFNSEGSVSCRRFHQSRSIADVLDEIDLGDHRYLVIEDQRGSILGIVEIEDLLIKTSSSDPVERRRWCELPIEAAISARLDSYNPCKEVTNQTSLETPSELLATTISTANDNVAALFLDDDLYLRWSSIKEILHHALVDTVTGLPNRMVFERRLTEEWQRLKRNSNSVCVLLIDLDYFKTINDQYGHCVGDIVLREIGNTLQSHLRSYDLLVRYGGDEFAAVLTGCTAAQLAIPIQRIREGLRALSVNGFPDLPPFSLSVGAVLITSQKDVHTVSDIVRMADVCLYEAKEKGRGCAYISDLTGKNKEPQRIEGDLVGANTKEVSTT